MSDDARDRAAAHLRQAAAHIEDGKKSEAAARIDSALGLWPSITSAERALVLQHIESPGTEEDDD